MARPRSPIQRLRDRLAGIERALGQTRGHVLESKAVISEQVTRLDSHVRSDTDVAIAELTAVVRALSDEISALAPAMAALEGHASRREERLLEILRVGLDQEPARRAQLRQARTTRSYELAYSDPEPLVSVVIPTWTNYRMLAERSLPSVLKQTYRHFEVLVVGDAAPPEAEEVVRSFGDARFRYLNLERRGPYPADAVAARNAGGIPPYNEGCAQAQGRWIASLDDDDAFRPEHISSLLELARRDRAEVSYGKFEINYREPDQESVIKGTFPPELGEWGMQMALYHADLRFFELELSDSLFSLPSDWAWCQRLLRAGVRFAMLDDVVTDYYPSWSWLVPASA